MKHSLEYSYLCIIADQDKLIEKMYHEIKGIERLTGRLDIIDEIHNLKANIDKNRAAFTKNAQLEKDYVAVTFNNL